jgi:hypothetical protein
MLSCDVYTLNMERKFSSPEPPASNGNPVLPNGESDSEPPCPVIDLGKITSAAGPSECQAEIDAWVEAGGIPEEG